MTTSILVPLELHICEAGFAFCMVQLLRAVAGSLCKIMVQDGVVSPWHPGSAVQSGIRDFLSRALLNIFSPHPVLLASVGLHTKLHHSSCPFGTLSRAWSFEAYEEQ